MDIYYNPLDLRCKSTTGGIEQNEELTINIYGKSKNEPCLLVLQKDECEAQYLHMQNTPGGWKINLTIQEPGLYFYYFKFGGRKAGAGQFRNLEFSEQVTAYQLLVYSKDFQTPDWFKGGIMYQIFPDRFNKSGPVPVEEGKWLHRSWNELPEFRKNKDGKILNNDFFGGNLRGIIEKLDYLKSLNVSVLYFNPIFRAYSNHRYDTGDYNQIDPMLGTEEDFAVLVQECRKRGIRIILDGVFNHTGDDSIYFNKYGKYDEIGAYQSQNSKYYAWYTFKQYPNKYDSWWGIDTLPAVNEHCASYVEFITGENGVLRHWLRHGLGGYRLDVADELPDEFIAKIRSSVKRADRDAVLIGEVWEDASNKIAYGKRRKYFQGNELDSVMNYPLKDAIINYVISHNTSLFRQTVSQLLDHYPKTVLDSLMNILGTHDTARILTVLGGVCVYDKEEMSKTVLRGEDRELAKKRLKVAGVLLFTLFGVPCIYYGDEIGMEGYSDPFCRKPFDWENMDGDILSHYRRLSQIRTGYSVFKEGRYRELFADANCIVFERREGKEVVLVAVNLGNNKYDIRFRGKLYDLLHGGVYLDKIPLNPLSYGIFGNKKIEE